MSDIVGRLRGQEPLHLGDRSAAADEIDHIRATCERWRAYAGHKPGCIWWEVPVNKKVCSCGYDALVKDLEESK